MYTLLTDVLEERIKTLCGRPNMTKCRKNARTRLHTLGAQECSDHAVSSLGSSSSSLDQRKPDPDDSVSGFDRDCHESVVHSFSSESSIECLL